METSRGNSYINTIVHYWCCSFILAVVDDDSTIAYYNIFKDIHPPDLPNRETRNYKQ